jgi:hypothetical protein
MCSRRTEVAGRSCAVRCYIIILPVREEYRYISKGHGQTGHAELYRIFVVGSPNGPLNIASYRKDSFRALAMVSDIRTNVHAFMHSWKEKPNWRQ